jgi:hypothetical protein
MPTNLRQPAIRYRDAYFEHFSEPDSRGLVPAIHVFVSTGKVVGARAKPGHDTERSQPRFKQHRYVPADPYLGA